MLSRPLKLIPLVYGASQVDGLATLKDSWELHVKLDTVD